MKMLLAGPGTGKTSHVNMLIENEYPDAKDILVVSFTNATVNDLIKRFAGKPSVRCYTLHSYALVINHLTGTHVLDDDFETPILDKFATKYGIEFDTLCNFFKCITFDRMIKSCLEFLKANPAYAKEKIGFLDLLVVDEFQDFNAVERELVFQLSNHARETIVLGDDDQSIYGFKDADPVGIIDLFNDSRVQKIPHENKCFRCPDVVVGHSKNLIKKNSRRVDKVWTPTGKTGTIDFLQFLTQTETSAFVVDQVKKIRKSDPQSSILVLSPVRYYVDDLIGLLQAEQIPLVDFWVPKVSPEDIKKTWWLRAIFSDKKLLNLTFLANASFTNHFKDKYNGKIRNRLQSDFNEPETALEVRDMFPQPFSEYLRQTPQIGQFIAVHPEYQVYEQYLNPDNLEESLKSISRKIAPDIRFDERVVNVMSIHKSKGLEADHVFVSGLVEGVLPNKIRGIDTIEAQRRLLFVGMTRARKSLYMISQVQWEGKYVHRMDASQFAYDYRKKQWNGKASSFISEMK
jgi:superfamily I DNA/RNA helicase